MRQGDFVLQGGLDALWSGMGEFNLHLGDCLEGMAKLADRSVDLVVTSPPYNLGVDYSGYDDAVGRGEYLEWSKRWMAEVARLLTDDGAFFLNVGSSPSNPYLPHEIALAGRDLFSLQNTIHWVKSITVETRDGMPLSVGHFKPINSKRFLNDCHEYVFHFTKSGEVAIDRLAVGVPYQDKSNIARWGHTGGRDLRCRGNTWFIPYKTIQSREKERPHPATFPPELVAQCIRLHGRGETTMMLDPFLGIGNAAVAAKREKLASFTGFEIDASYLAIAREALAKESGFLL